MYSSLKVLLMGVLIVTVLDLVVAVLVSDTKPKTSPGRNSQKNL